MADEEKPDFQKAADRLAEERDTDVLFFNGPIERHLDQRVIELCLHRRRRKNVMLMLVTEGGDPHAAYRIARCLQDKYSRYTAFVPGYCKSAGTIIALGAHELLMSDFGELGPLDVQLARKDELFEKQSGLTATSALSTLHEQAFAAFEHFMLNLKMKAGASITTRTATDFAVKMACGLFEPVYGQIDPLHVGEAGRALSVARRYGEMLDGVTKNLKEDALDALVSKYPSHSFIIDRSEAQKLFRNVREPSDLEASLPGFFKAYGRWPTARNEEPIIAFLSSELAETVAKIHPVGANANDGQEGPEPSTDPEVGGTNAEAPEGAGGAATAQAGAVPIRPRRAAATEH